MSKYAQDALDALADIQEAGAPLTFTLTSPGTYDPATDTWTTPTVTTVAGSALEVGNDPDLFAALGLVLVDPATLLFAPTTAGQMPLPGYAVTWGGVAYTVKSVLPTNPDGAQPIIARIVVSR